MSLTAACRTSPTRAKPNPVPINAITGSSAAIAEPFIQLSNKTDSLLASCSRLEHMHFSGAELNSSAYSFSEPASSARYRTTC